MLKSILSFWPALLVLPLVSYSQSLPRNLHYHPETHFLGQYKENEAGFYDQEHIAEVNLQFYDANYWNLLTQYYNTENYVVAKLIYNGMEYDSVGVQFKGQTSYFVAKQQGSTKFSFDIKMGEFVDGQDIDGYSTLNFNNAFEDDSFMREVMYGHLAGRHIPAARGNFIHLYLNGVDWGLYSNIQQVNKDFLEEWFSNNDGIRWRADVPESTPTGPPGPGGPGSQWGDGTAALNYLGSDASEYQKYYTLKSSDLDDPWSYLIRACEVLDAPYSERYLDSIQAVYNLDATLWFLATEILFSDDDSYVYKGKMDYSLYYDPETGWIQPLEIDGNSVMEMRNLNWDVFYHADNANYPLLNRLLSIPEVRQRYLAHVRTLLDDSFNEAGIEKIETFRNRISSIVQNDTKSRVPFYRFNREVDTLKSFLVRREQFLMNHPELKNVESPALHNVRFSVNGEDWKTPQPQDMVTVSASAAHPAGIQQMILYIGRGFYGAFQQIPMTYNGSEYQASFSGFEPGEFVRFYVEAVAGNAAGTRSYFPAGAEHDVLIFRVEAKVLAESDVVINELMASNTETAQDQDGEYDDWIELYNNSPEPVDLSGYYLSDKSDNLTKWTIPANTVIEGHGYLIFWADEDQDQEGLHTNFKLSKSGEEVYLLTPGEEVADHVVFGALGDDLGYARVPNGTGNFMIQAPTFGTNNDGVTGVSAVSDTQAYVLIAPNPASGWVKLLPLNMDGTSPVYKIFDTFGREVLRGQLNAETILDISGWKPGTYMVVSGHMVQKMLIH